MSAQPTGALAQSFNFSPAFSVRCIVRDGEPWFVAKDVAEALEYTWNGAARIEHVPEEWRGVTSVVTPSGDQEMLILSEQGLYFFLGRSDKPKALPFQKWLAGEVLPSIRKTGRYEVPQDAQPVPPSTSERLTVNDMLNLQRAIHFASRTFNHQRVWSNGIWHYLRQSTQHPSPQPFLVQHLPRIATDMHYFMAVMYWTQDLISEIEKEMVRRVFRNGETADLVLNDLKRSAEKRLAEMKEEMLRFPSWMQSDFDAIVLRKPAYAIHYNTQEQQLGLFAS